MSTHFPLFPPSASSVAQRDRPALSLHRRGQRVLRGAGRGARRRLRDQVPPPAAPTRSARDIHGSLALELTLDDHPARPRDGDVRLGRRRSSSDWRGRRADAMEIYVVGKQWMWKIQHPDGRARDQRAARAGRPPVRLTIGSEDVIHDFFVPAFRVKMDVVPGPLHDDVVHGDEAGHVPHLLRGVLRHEALGHDRHGHRDGRRRTTRPGWRAARSTGTPAAERRAAVHGPGVRHLPPGDSRPGRGPSLAGVFGSTVDAGRRPDGRSPTRTTCASRS